MILRVSLVRITFAESNPNDEGVYPASNVLTMTPAQWTDAGYSQRDPCCRKPLDLHPLRFIVIPLSCEPLRTVLRVNFVTLLFEEG